MWVKLRKHAKIPKPSTRYVFVAAIAVLGSALLLAVRAGSPVAVLESESATITAPATRQTDATASGGSYLAFGGPGNKPSQLSGSWGIVFEDDFSNATKSLTETWSTRPPFTTYHPGSVTAANGLITLKTGTISNYEWAHISTDGPRSSTEPNYPKMKAWREGYFEARIRYTDSEWSWPAFWLFSASKVEAWPGENCPAKGGFYNAEWDMMENGVQNGWQHRPASSWYVRVIHKNTSDGTSDGYCGTPDEDRQFAKDYTGQAKLSDWHTWGGRWIGDELCTYLDNQLINCITAFDTMRQPMVMNIDIAFLGNCPSWCGTKPKELELQVDWVKVWQRN